MRGAEEGISPRPGIRSEEEGQQPGGDHVCVEITLESLARRDGGLRPSRLVVEQSEERGRRLGRVVEGPEPGFYTVVTEFGDGTDVAGHDGKASGHRFDDRQR